MSINVNTCWLQVMFENVYNANVNKFQWIWFRVGDGK